MVIDYDEAPLMEQLKTGYDFLVKNPLISVFGFCSFAILISFLIQGYSLLPMYITHHLKAEAGVLATTELMYGTGSLVSGIIIGRILRKLSIPMSIIILTFLTSFGFFLAAFSSSVAIYYTFALIIGFTNSGSRIFRVSYLFGLIPNKIMGRVNSMFNVYSTIIRTGFLILFSLSFFNEGSNVIYAYMILGTFALISGLVLVSINGKILALTATEKAEAELVS
jgi:MFS family permease